MDRGALVAVVLAGAVVGGACSSGDGEDTSQSSVPAPPRTTIVADTAPPETSVDTASEPAATTATTVSAVTSPPAPSLVTTPIDPVTTPPPVEFVPTLNDLPCDVPVPVGAICHRIDLPAKWDDPATWDTEPISLPIVVLPAQSGDPDAQAVVVPAGGPGDTGITAAEFFATTTLNAHNTVVLYDQRGTGFAEPNLECPERDAAFVAILQRDDPFEDERAAIVDAFLQCKLRLEQGGVDLDDYDTEASVRDLDAIRGALGHDQWNILGISYGARLALAALRSAPDGIRSVVLDSVYDVTQGGIGQTARNAERAFEQLVDGCTADPDCAAANPDLGATLDAIVSQYNETPLEIEVDLGDGAGARGFVITGDDVVGGLFVAMYDATLIPLLPGIMTAFAAGETAIAAEIIRSGVPFATGAADGMAISVNCADNAGLGEDLDVAAVEDPGRTRILVTDILCSEWVVEPTSEDFNEPVRSDIPALVLAGLYDPITPPLITQAVAETLTNATFGLWPNRSHGVSGDPCAGELTLAFFANPELELDLSCLEALGPLDFG